MGAILGDCRALTDVTTPTTAHDNPHWGGPLYVHTPPSRIADCLGAQTRWNNPQATQATHPQPSTTIRRQIPFLFYFIFYRRCRDRADTVGGVTCSLHRPHRAKQSHSSHTLNIPDKEMGEMAPRPRHSISRCAYVQCCVITRGNRTGRGNGVLCVPGLPYPALASLTSPTLDDIHALDVGCIHHEPFPGTAVLGFQPIPVSGPGSHFAADKPGHQVFCKLAILLHPTSSCRASRADINIAAKADEQFGSTDNNLYLGHVHTTTVSHVGLVPFPLLFAPFFPFLSDSSNAGREMGFGQQIKLNASLILVSKPRGFRKARELFVVSKRRPIGASSPPNQQGTRRPAIPYPSVPFSAIS